VNIIIAVLGGGGGGGGGKGPFARRKGPGWEVQSLVFLLHSQMDEKKSHILSSPFSSTHLNRRGGPCLCYPSFTFQYFVGERQINMQKVSAAGLASRI
jgi:hypothetical protein